MSTDGPTPSGTILIIKDITIILRIYDKKRVFVVNAYECCTMSYILDFQRAIQISHENN